MATKNGAKKVKKADILESIKQFGDDGEQLCCMKCSFNSFMRLVDGQFPCQHPKHKGEMHSYEDWCPDFKRYIEGVRRR